MTKKLVAVVVSLLTGCSTSNNTELIHFSSTKTIQWRKVNDVDSYCRARLANPKPDLTYRGCADWRDPNKCIITTGMYDDFEIIGHELKHCFNGDFHS